MTEPQSMDPVKAGQVLSLLAGEHQCLAQFHVQTGRVFHDQMQLIAKESPDRLGESIDAAYGALLTHQSLAQHHNEVSNALAMAISMLVDTAEDD